MTSYPNYRVCVEAYIVREGKVLIGKRAPGLKIAPGGWTVPRGKVEYDEIPEDAISRESEEEVGYVGLFSHFYSHTFSSEDVDGEPYYRLNFCYVSEADKDFMPILDEDELSEFAWVDASNIAEFPDLFPDCKEIILSKVLK